MRIFHSLIILSILASGLQAQVQHRINTAFQTGNSTVFESHLDSQVEMHIDDEAHNISGDYAHQRLNTFFSHAEPSGFDILHQGGSGGHEFVVGRLSTNRGIFRVTYTLVNKNGSQVIRKIKIE